MLHFDTKIVLSATDFVTFLGCQHATYLNLMRLDGFAERTPPNEQAQLLRDKGLEQEQAYLETLKRKGCSVVEIDRRGNLLERADETRKAIDAHPDYIYQATLLKEQWLGVADFLMKTESGSGSPNYEPVDVKLARSPSVNHVFQLSVYSELIRSSLGLQPKSMNLLLADSTQVSLPVNDFASYCRNAMRRLELFIQDPPRDSYPEPCQQCERCSWRDDCRGQWKQDDHLSLVADIRRSQIDKLRDAGVNTVLELSQLMDDACVPKLSDLTLVKLRSQAALQVSSRGTDRHHHELLMPSDGKGFGRIPEPDPGDIFFDIEGDPLYPDGLEYLFGIYVVDNNQPRFHAFWAHDHASERKAFQEVIDFMIRRLEMYPSSNVYHYAHYEETAFKRLASRYATRESELDSLLRNRKFVDLYKVLRKAIRISEPSYSLKNVEVFYKASRTGEVATATDSIVVYERWRKSTDEKLLEEIGSYNKEDCRSTYLLREWLLAIKPKNIPWFDLGTASTDAEKTKRLEAAERTRLEYERKLLEVLPTNASQLGQLVAYLLEFHRREAKPSWWALFDRRDKSEEELVEDSECLGGLRFQAEPRPVAVKQSTIRTYAFPPQDFKLKEGDGCLMNESLEWAGTVEKLDEEGLTVQIKRGNRMGLLPEAFSLLPKGPIDDVVLRKAIYRFADSVISMSSRYQALLALLNRDPPSISGHSPGAQIVREEPKDLIPEILDVVANLERSYLFIQGPPGSGKTYTASDVIVDLIKAGRRIGVSSNSHKAINNLLTAVEQKSQLKGVPLCGVKKSTGGRPETLFNGSFIEDVTSNESVDQSADLIAGTAWLFAREEFDQVLDYLFIDEAGQVSLANVVAMGLSARNIVLIGDPMQLAQPIQGVHPGESGQSALEYLLQDRATVPRERGIFLPTTWRMHDKLCSFISEAVYEGRLKPEASNQRQRLLLSDLAHPSLKEAGLSFVPVLHSGCSQKSEEEADLIHRIVGNLLCQQYRGKDGTTRKVKLENILVVSPYNMQVNHLKSVLPSDARVGTVDKFQGQEAEVVVISMATSSGEDLPKHIEFLYSKNRLNVAISRGKILSVIVANPKLLEIQCRTIEQLRLVNTLCRAKSYSDRN